MGQTSKSSRSASDRPARLFLAAALSGALHGYALLPSGSPWLGFVALTPLFFALTNHRAIHRLIAGWIWALAVSVVGGHWFPQAVVRYFDQTPWVGFLAFLFTVFVTGALYYGVVLVLLPTMRRMSEWLQAVSVGVLWATLELIRVELPNWIPGLIGNPWGVVGYSQSRNLEFIQIADIGGVFAVSAVLVAFNSGLALALAKRRHAIRFLSMPLALVALSFIYGLVRLNADSPEKITSPIGVIQADLDSGNRWERSEYGRNLQTYLRLTRSVLDREPSAIVFWPEAAMTFMVESEPSYRRSIARTLKTPGTQLVAGGARSIDSGKRAFANSVFVIGGDGSVLDRFDKQHLIPLAEAPATGVWSTLQRRQFDLVDHFVPGPESDSLQTSAGPAAVLICQEALFGSVTRSRVAPETAYIFNPANDSWVGDAAFGQQLLEIVRFRAIENGREIVRASTSGPSGVIDHRGRYRELGQLFEAQFIHSYVRVQSKTTAYGHLGDSLLCMSAIFLAALRFSKTQQFRTLTDRPANKS